MVASIGQERRPQGAIARVPAPRIDLRMSADPVKNRAGRARGGGGCFGTQIDLRQAIPDEIDPFPAPPLRLEHAPGDALNVPECIWNEPQGQIDREIWSRDQNPAHNAGGWH
ncbi:hypothetical protein EMEDMD4_210056 [Sinorhizobium medicae]|uniref:Uncharacterized protein n=1 Tax=Sinorhizobium medicae TaxID=110321 RepID=A0A508WUH2_9HYPH|nr:hypothetical protein EMEDMD4_210056 [Sinorhizobium medicae]